MEIFVFRCFTYFWYFFGTRFGTRFGTLTEGEIKTRKKDVSLQRLNEIDMKKQSAKVKEPVKLWVKQLANGNQSLYLKTYKSGSDGNGFEYECLRLYLVPDKGGRDKVARIKNENTLQAANMIKNERLKEIAEGRAGIKSNKAEKMLLVDWMKIYQERKLKLGQSKSNAVTIHNTLSHLIKYKGDKVTMAQVDKKYCIGFVLYLANGKTIGTDKKRKFGEHRERPLAKGTAKLYFNTFITALNEAVRDGIILVNPTTQMKKEEKKPINVSSNTRPFLDIEEVKMLVTTPCRMECVKSAFLFACFCGLRVSDILSLKWENVKIAQDGSTTIIKRQVKTQQEIIVPLSESALRWLPERNAAKENESVFDLPNVFTINRELKVWAKAAEINKNLTFHISRHTFATTLLTLGADLYTASKLLGHQNVRTTQIYAEVVNKKKVEAVNLMDGIF